MFNPIFPRTSFTAPIALRAVSFFEGQVQPADHSAAGSKSRGRARHLGILRVSEFCCAFLLLFLYVRSAHGAQVNRTAWLQMARQRVSTDRPSLPANEQPVCCGTHTICCCACVLLAPPCRSIFLFKTGTTGNKSLGTTTNATYSSGTYPLTWIEWKTARISKLNRVDRVKT